ncbi:MAG: glycosyltransferase [Bacteroidota bacterium]
MQKHTLPGVISIIVPVRNEQNNIISLLHSLKVQDYDPEFYEIIVVDDHSTDATEQVVRKFKHQNLSLNVKLIQLTQNESSKKTALQKGIKNSRGEMIIMTDADCKAGINYLSTINEYYKKHQPLLMIGPVKMKNYKSGFSKIQALEFLSLIFTAGGSSKSTSALMANGANLIVDRQVFTDMLRKDIFKQKHASGDDMFLVNFVKQTYGRQSVQFIKHEDAVMATNTAQSLHDFMFQRKRWVSKSKSYSDPWLITTALLVLATSFVQLVSLFWGIFAANILIFAVVIWLIKISVDFIVLRTTAQFFKQQELLWWFLPASVIYPFYVVVSAFSGLFSGYTWKGRTYSRGQ